MNKLEEINKILNGKGDKIFKMYFWGWYSLKEASKRYNPNLKDKQRNHRTVAYYFYKFKELNFLDEKNIIKEFPRKTAKEEESTYPNKCLRYKANFNIFYDYCKEKHNIEFKPKEKRFVSDLLDPIFSDDNVLSYGRLKILQDYPKDNIIDAIIKFYIKESYSYGDLLKVESSNENKNLLKMSLKELKEFAKKFKGVDIPSAPYIYVETYKKNPRLVLSVDKKFKQALGIL